MNFEQNDLARPEVKFNTKKSDDRTRRNYLEVKVSLCYFPAKCGKKSLLVNEESPTQILENLASNAIRYSS